MKLKHIAMAVSLALGNYAVRSGLANGALALEVDKLDAVPESQRAWYEEDRATKKFKLNPEKVEIEDVGGLKSALQTERENNRKAKAATEKAVKDALAQYEGIDPEKTREMLKKLGSDEEAALIAAGKLDEVVARRTKKAVEEYERKIREAGERESGALEVASTFMDRVLDNHVRAAAAEAGIHPTAIKDALLRASQIFSLDDEGNAVQYEEDGTTVVLGKDGKTPFSPKEWIESMKEEAPHWFPAGASGGGAPGNKGGKGGADLSKLSPTARLTAARAAQGGK